MQKSNLKNDELIQELGISNFSESKCLPGAISADATIFYSRVYNDGEDKICIPDWTYFSCLVSEDFKEDRENGIYWNENGAVANAFSLRRLSSEQQLEALQTIKSSYEQEYPNYNFVIKEGRFPVEGNQFVDHSDPIASMSTHILYIQNFRECILPKKTR